MKRRTEIAPNSLQDELSGNEFAGKLFEFRIQKLNELVKVSQSKEIFPPSMHLFFVHVQIDLSVLINVRFKQTFRVEVMIAIVLVDDVVKETVTTNSFLRVDLADCRLLQVQSGWIRAVRSNLTE